MTSQENSEQQISCAYVLTNSQTNQLKIGATKCLTRRLWEHETGLEGFELQFYVPSIHPFILERFLHKYIAEHDLIIEICQQREVYKCQLEETLNKLRQYISNLKRLVWYTTVYKNNKTAVLLRMPCRRDFIKHTSDVELEIKQRFSEYIKPDYWKTYYQNHREHMIEHQKQYYKEHRESILPKMRERYQRIKASQQSQPV